MDQFVVYILYSDATGKYYCGQTHDLDDRLLRHNSARSKSTKNGVPWTLIKTFTCSCRSEALKLESIIKSRGIKRYIEGVDSKRNTTIKITSQVSSLQRDSFH